MVRLAGAVAVTLAGAVTAVVLHGLHFITSFPGQGLDGRPWADRVATVPPWRDPLAVACAFAAIAAAVRVVIRRPRRLVFALGMVGCAFAGAVYLHQQATPTLWCGTPLGCFLPSQPDLWHYSTSLLIMAAGVAAGLVPMLPRRWIVAPQFPRRA